MDLPCWAAPSSGCLATASGPCDGEGDYQRSFSRLWRGVSSQACSLPVHSLLVSCVLGKAGTAKDGGAGDAASGEKQADGRPIVPTGGQKRWWKLSPHPPCNALLVPTCFPRQKSLARRRLQSPKRPGNPSSVSWLAAGKRSGGGCYPAELRGR